MGANRRLSNNTRKRWDPHEHVGNVPPFGHEVAVRGLLGNVDHIPGAHRIPHSTRDARAPAACAVEHFAAHEQGPFAALYEHDVDAVVVSNTLLSNDYNVLALAAPGIASQVQPGQFVMVKPGVGDDPLLRANSGLAWV